MTGEWGRAVPGRIGGGGGSGRDPVKVARGTQLVVPREYSPSCRPQPLPPPILPSRMDRLLFVLLLALAKGEEEATVETVRDDVETVGGHWGRVRDPESPLVHLQVRITPEMS